MVYTCRGRVMISRLDWIPYHSLIAYCLYNAFFLKLLLFFLNQGWDVLIIWVILKYSFLLVRVGSCKQQQGWKISKAGTVTLIFYFMSKPVTLHNKGLNMGDLDPINIQDWVKVNLFETESQSHWSSVDDCLLVDMVTDVRRDSTSYFHFPSNR